MYTITITSIFSTIIIWAAYIIKKLKCRIRQTRSFTKKSTEGLVISWQIIQQTFRLQKKQKKSWPTISLRFPYFIVLYHFSQVLTTPRRNFSYTKATDESWAESDIVRVCRWYRTCITSSWPCWRWTCILEHNVLSFLYRSTSRYLLILVVWDNMLLYHWNYIIVSINLRHYKCTKH